MSIYTELGLNPIVNANATLTRLGGSRMPPEVWDAMRRASREFVDLDALQRAVSTEIAALTHNEGCYVSCGAASGIVLAVAACMIQGETSAADRMADRALPKKHVIVHRRQRNQYDYAIRQAYAEIREIGHTPQAPTRELELAVDDETAALLWFAGELSQSSPLKLSEAIRICHERDVPVIVDAAAQLPPTRNLWSFAEMGADMVIFSGGKDLRGPQSSGLVLGKRKWTEVCHALGAPNPGIGRPMKVGKEEMVGLLVAVRRYLQLDEETRREEDERTVRQWRGRLAEEFPALRTRRGFPNEAGQPLPRLEVIFPPESPWRRETVAQALLHGRPSVSVAEDGDHSLFLNPMTLEPEERTMVIQRLLEVLRQQQRTE